MKILVDCRYTRIDHHDGISRYGSRIAEALSRRHPVTMLISDERQLALLPELPWVKASGPTSVREPLLARQINAFGPDAVFSPMQTMGTWGRRYGLVLTLHDLIYYTNRTPPRELPGFVRVLWRLYHLAWWPQRLLLNRADEIATVSETTKGLMRRRRLTRRPIHVVTNAPDPLTEPIVRTPPVPAAGEPRDLVYMGSFMPYKNVDTLVGALHELPGYRLRLMSRVPDAERARLTALAPDGAVEFLNGVSDEEYAAALRAATAFVHASRDEGFGIPLVEAMVQGTPVVASDIPIFREVGAQAAAYFPPDDPSALAAAVRELEQPAVWQARSDAGLARAAEYDWDRAAGVLLEMLERVARRP